MWEKITAEQYAKMKETDIRTADPAAVPDIRDIHVDPSLPPAERIREAARQMKGNPFSTAAAAFWSRPPLPAPVPSRQFWKTAWNILNDSTGKTRSLHSRKKLIY